jgi:acyl transferase domain-containing protein/acyl carrier protein
MNEHLQDGPIEAIAIVGLAGRFPRARNLDEFWARLVAGEELVTFFDDAELAAAGTPPEQLANPNYVKARAVLEDADLFDAGFFRVNPREAELMDPQQRLFLECAWEALENAGYDPGQYPGAIGVYAGLSPNSYLLNNLMRSQTVFSAAGAYQVMLASDKDFLATRTAYKLDLHGPAVTVQTACSTSLVAVQMACQSLLAYQCDMALAGGVSIASPRVAGYEYQPGMILSPDGHCRTFDARGHGIVPGEGAGLVVLKRMSEALADGDTIHAVIKGAAINNDGAQKVGYTAPGVDGQAEVIAMAQAMAGVSPESISYVEAHGTATELGDPIEVAALTQAFAVGTDKRGYCGLGSVKTNMGHLDAAAGIAGLLKTVLALEHGVIPPSLHFERANPNIDFESSPFYVVTNPQPWLARAGNPRRAGVSSFGIGGTNAHVVLEEASRPAVVRSARPYQLLVSSAPTATALDNTTHALGEHLRNHLELDVADLAYTLQVGRKTFSERRAIVVSSDVAEAAQTLAGLQPGTVLQESTTGRARPVMFLFPGQGSQYVHMARGLYTAEPMFQAELDRCANILLPHLELDIRDVLFPPPGGEASATQRLQETALTQPVLFSVEYALAKLWMSWGIVPSGMLGHSVGEYVAACLAGVFSLEDALALVATRGQLMQALPRGDMLAVSLSETEIATELGDNLALAAINGAHMCVVSGARDDVQALRERLETRGVSCRPLHTSHAFHSAMMEPALEPFTRRVAEVALDAPELAFVSNVTGTWITREQATDPGYWARHLRSTVRFADGLATLLAQQDTVLLEVGPGQTLSSLVRLHPARTNDQLAVASMRHPHDPTADHKALLSALGRLWVSGVDVDWLAVHAPEKRARIPLPTYPFERQRYWVEPETPMFSEAASNASAAVTFPSRRDDLDSWFYQPSWKRLDRPCGLVDTLESAMPEQDWLVFDDNNGLGEQLIERLTARRQRVARVVLGITFATIDVDTYCLPADDPEGYRALLRALQDSGRMPARIVHLWNTGPVTPGALSEEIADIQGRAFYSLTYLAQALAEHATSATLQIDVVGNGVFDVLGDEPLEPSKATLLGPCRVIPQEYPWRCRYLDVRLPDEKSEELTTRVWAELLQPGDANIVALRGRHRWVPGFEAVQLEPGSAATPLLRERGVYLITGGLGGVGLALAEYLARTVQARLVLTGRGRLPERHYWDAWQAEHGPNDPVSRRVSAVRRLEEEFGAEVLTIAADVTDATQMRQAVTAARARFGRIDGVVHAAGLPGGGVIAQKTREQAEQVLAPKVLGTVVLADAVHAETLDFFALCSSTASLLGSVGLVDYAAANAYLDAFAHAQTRLGNRVIAINWGVWQEVGMAADAPVTANLQSIKDARLRDGMRTAEAQLAFGRILANPLPQVVVSTQDLHRLSALYAQNDKVGTRDVAEAPAIHARPRVDSAFAAPNTDIEEQLAGIWRTLLGFSEIGIHDSFFDLGGHSLMATQLLARVQHLYRVQLPLRSVFEHKTIAELAAQIEAVRWAAAQVDEVTSEDGEREEIEL